MSSARGIAKRRIASDVFLAALCLVVAVMLWWPSELWVLDVAASFRIQAGVIALLLGLARLTAKRLVPVVLWWMAAGFCLLGPLLDPLHVGLDEGAGSFRLVLQNVHTNNRSFSLVTVAVREQQPDLAIFLETDDLWAGALRQQLQDLLPHAVVKPRSDNFGVSMFSAQPVDAEILETPPLGIPSIEAVVLIDGQFVRLIATHPIPPLTAQRTRLRDEHIAAVLARAANSSIPTVIVGDLNLAPTSPAYHRLFADARVRRVQGGLLPAGTWPSVLGIIGVCIDHVLVSDTLRAHHAALLPGVGSDHRGVVVDLSVQR